MKAYVEIRRQKSRGTWPKCGPDTYVAVQVVPDNVQKLVSLQQKAANNRGITLI